MAASKQKSEDLRSAEIGCVVALPMEIAPLLSKCEKVRKYSGGDFVFRGGKYRGIRLAVVETGTGATRARKGTLALIDGHAPQWVLSVGFSGAMIPELQAGDMVVANEIVDAGGNCLSLDLKMGENRDAGYYVGRLLTADRIVRTVKEKEDLHQQTGAIAVDLESLAVAQACRDSGTKFMAVRVISDDMSEDLPPEILSILGGTGTIRWGATLGAIWNRPGSVTDMWKLREKANLAAERLAGYLDTIFEGLAATLKK